jgi:hypothetical protein
MKKGLSYSLVLVSALTALPVAHKTSAAGEGDEVRHTVVAASGAAAPGGGVFLPFSFINARLNARHEVAFDAVVTGPPFSTGIFVGDGHQISAIALGANADPSAPSFGDVFNPFITPSGVVVFQSNASDIFARAGKTTVPLARNGDDAPGGGTLGPTLLT